MNPHDKEEQMQNQIFSKKKEKRVKKDKNDQIQDSIQKVVVKKEYVD